ncbi:MAG: hypothetical protein IAE78_06935 [Myxococcus sp.]|nr:hypothetical protein [Myxococcus sp.]
MFPSRRATVFVVVALALAPLTALATVVMALSLEELTERAPVVVHGTVRRSVTGWAEGKRGIWTWTEIAVRESLKGAPRTTALVKQPGGVLDGVGQRVSGAGRFEEGEEVVLFLEPAVDEPNAFVLLAMAAGKVTLEGTVGPKVARRDLKGLSFAQRGGKGVAGPVAERETLGTAEAFLARVRAAAKGATK